MTSCHICGIKNCYANNIILHKDTYKSIYADDIMQIVRSFEHNNFYVCDGCISNCMNYSNIKTSIIKTDILSSQLLDMSVIFTDNNISGNIMDFYIDDTAYKFYSYGISDKEAYRRAFVLHSYARKMLMKYANSIVEEIYNSMTELVIDAFANEAYIQRAKQRGFIPMSDLSKITKVNPARISKIRDIAQFDVKDIKNFNKTIELINKNRNTKI